MTPGSRLPAGMLETALDAMPHGFALFGPDGRCVMANAAYRQFLAACGASSAEVAALDDELARRCREATSEDCVLADGAWRHETYPTPEGGFGAICMRAPAPQPPTQPPTQGFHDSVFENVPAMMFVKDGQTGRFLLVNRAAEEALGVPRAELLGRNDADFFPADQAAYFAEVDRQVMESGELVTIPEEPLDTPHNGRRWLQTRKIAAPFADGRRHLLIICEDITERKANAAALTEALQQAEAASVAKSEFLANMSHEIRTPLNGVLGMAEVLGRTPLQPDQQAMLRTILNSGRTLNLLLSDILDLSKVEAGAFDLVCEPLDLREAVASAVNVFAAAASDKGVGFRFAFDDDFDGAVMGDGLRIRQVVANLTSNAVKFTSSGEVAVDVGTKAEDDGRLRLCVTVRDTGPGFDADDGHRLFERFQQVDGSITRRFGGSGLGLPIARSLARLMGGDITWTAAPGVGATFRFEAVLHRHEALASVREPVAQPSAIPGRRPRILLAEDHPTNQEVVLLMLAPVADVVVVDNGQAAVEAFAEGRFDAVLMDTQMPVMDGLSAIRAIRSAEQGRGARRSPIISLTANAMPHQVAACLEAGADLHLPKPVNMGDLYAALNATLIEQEEAPCAEGARHPAQASCGSDRSRLHRRRVRAPAPRGN